MIGTEPSDMYAHASPDYTCSGGFRVNYLKMSLFSPYRVLLTKQMEDVYDFVKALFRNNAYVPMPSVFSGNENYTFQYLVMG